MDTADQENILPHLERTIDALEDVMVAGLTTASAATSKTLAITFQEAARHKLLRLGSTLRSTNEEITRFVKDDARFSQARLMFFLHRSWLLCLGIQRAIQSADQQRLKQLLWSPTTRPVEDIEVVCLGVNKKVAAGNFCAFEFRLRSVADQTPFLWSTVFPMKAGTKIPAEGYLHLPQKQKFTTNIFLEQRIIHLGNIMVSENLSGPARIQMTDESQVTAGDAFADWSSLLNWNPATAFDNITKHEVSPLDVDVELQEEVCFFSDYTLSDPIPEPEQQRIRMPLHYSGLEFDITLSDGEEGESALNKLNSARKKKSHACPMLGLMHYSRNRLVIQPLTRFESNKPNYLTISDKSIDRRALLAAIKFN